MGQNGYRQSASPHLGSRHQRAGGSAYKRWSELFCAGHITFRDGRMLSVGGHALDHVGLRAGRIFNPATSQWTSTPDMAYGRWYPTLTTLPDGRILTLSGEVNCEGCYADVPEIYNPVSNTWSALPIASRVIPYYPHAFVLPDGRVLVTGTAEDPIPTYALNLTTQTWSVVDSRLLRCIQLGNVPLQAKS